SSLQAVLKFVRQSGAPTTFITRPPEMASHKSAMPDVSKLRSVEVVHLRNLHAKFFICDIAPIPFSLVGSANATRGSMSNLEIGVLVRGSGAAEGFIRDLQGLSIELRSLGTRVKKRGDQ